MPLKNIPIKTIYYSDGKSSYWFTLPEDNEYGIDINIGYWLLEDILQRWRNRTIIVDLSDIPKEGDK